MNSPMMIADITLLGVQPTIVSLEDTLSLSANISLITSSLFFLKWAL